MLPCVLSLAVFAAPVPEGKAEPFDFYTNPVLNKTHAGTDVKKVESLALDAIPDHDGILPGTNGTLLVVKTTQGRNAKLLVQSARQKVGEDKVLPVLLIDRYVTYKEGEEQTVVCKGEGLKLYPGFRFSLDLGQVVPEEVPADLALVKDGDAIQVKADAKAQVAVVTRYDRAIEPARTAKVIIGDPFEAKYHTGTYKLYDDGRRSGKLVLKVEEDGSVTGAFYSDRDGAKYEVRGRVATPAHAIQFTVNLPRTEQVFDGWLFTGDGKALVGTSRIGARQAGFYALRVED